MLPKWGKMPLRTNVNKSVEEDKRDVYSPNMPLLVGYKIPIYLVDDNDERTSINSDWEKTEWYFLIVSIDKKRNTANIEWPNGHIDKDVPMSILNGGVSKVPRSEISRSTEEYNSDDDILDCDAPEPQEKIAIDTIIYNVITNM